MRQRRTALVTLALLVSWHCLLQTSSAAGAEASFMYLDPLSEEQGPQTMASLLQSVEAGFFSDKLKVRAVGDAGEWVALAEAAASASAGAGGVDAAGSSGGGASGGWAVGTVDVLGRHASRECTIETRTTIQRPEFEKKFRNKRPLILRGGASNWRLRAALSSKDAFLSRVGTAPLQVDESKLLAHSGGVTNHSVPTAEFWAAEAKRTGAFGARTRCSALPTPVLAYDSGDFLWGSRLVDELRSDILPKNFVLMPEYDGAGNPGTLSQTLYAEMGSTCTGLPWHTHFESWNAQLVGQKYWMIYTKAELDALSDKDKQVSGRHTNMFSWIDKAKAAMATKPHECMVQAGDAIYLPGESYHGSVSIGDSVSVSGQTNVPPDEGQKAMHTGNKRYTQGKFLLAAKYFKKAADSEGIDKVKMTPYSTTTLFDLVTTKLVLSFAMAKDCTSAMQYRKQYSVNEFFEDKMDTYLSYLSHILRDVGLVRCDEWVREMDNKGKDAEKRRRMRKLGMKQRHKNNKKTAKGGAPRVELRDDL